VEPCGAVRDGARLRARDGIGRALCGTQPVVSLALVECGLEIFEQTTMAAIRAKSLALTDLFIALVEGAAPRMGWAW
jgi:kynureninase